MRTLISFILFTFSINTAVAYATIVSEKVGAAPKDCIITEMASNCPA
jgi:hypothetical protein